MRKTLSNKPPEQPQPGKNLGHGMMIVGWVVILSMLSLVFGHWEEEQYNPNRNVQSSSTSGKVEVVLERNRWGHYVADGTINGKTVTYLLDTGATDVSVPEQIARELGLKKGQRFSVSTANGSIGVYRTTIEKLTLGDIEMKSVRASINPYMQANEILLGMTVLQHLELVQRGNTLTIRK